MKTKAKKTKAERIKIETAKVHSITCKGCGHVAKLHVPKEYWPAIWLETARRVRVKAVEDVMHEIRQAMIKVLRDTNDK